MREAKSGEDSSDETVNSNFENVECPNCGRVFMGNYCPECGQEANPSVSVTTVVGGFFREAADTEAGFWPTFVGLTLHPGRTLHRYLSGVREGLMNPGRYLLAALAIHYAVGRGLVWIGVRVPISESSLIESSGATSADAPLVVRQAVTGMIGILESQEGVVVINLLVAGLLSLLFWRLFRDELGGEADALALVSFIVGQVTLVEVVVRLVHMPLTRLISGRPADDISVIYFGVVYGYVAWVTYSCFQPGLKSAIKGLLALSGVWVEIGSISAVTTIGYIAWLAQSYPERYPSGDGFVVVLTGFGILVATPLLLHICVEIYFRLWRAPDS